MEVILSQNTARNKFALTGKKFPSASESNADPSNNSNSQKNFANQTNIVTNKNEGMCPIILNDQSKELNFMEDNLRFEQNTHKIQQTNSYESDISTASLNLISNMIINGKNNNVLKAYKRAQYFRTRMCTHFLKNKTCKEGPSCGYAHSLAELKPSVNLTKTKLCEDYISGRCDKNETDCEFAHSYRKLRSTTGFYKTKMCKFWIAGRCSAGTFCRHAHGNTDCSILVKPTSDTFSKSFTYPKFVNIPSIINFDCNKNELEPITQSSKQNTDYISTSPKHNITAKFNPTHQKQRSVYTYPKSINYFKILNSNDQNAATVESENIQYISIPSTQDINFNSPNHANLHLRGQINDIAPLPLYTILNYVSPKDINQEKNYVSPNVCILNTNLNAMDTSNNMNRMLVSNNLNPIPKIAHIAHLQKPQAARYNYFSTEYGLPGHMAQHLHVPDHKIFKHNTSNQPVINDTNNFSVDFYKTAIQPKQAKNFYIHKIPYSPYVAATGQTSNASPYVSKAANGVITSKINDPNDQSQEILPYGATADLAMSQPPYIMLFWNNGGDVPSYG